MIELKEKIKHNFVVLEAQNIHKGCGFLFEVDSNIYCVTAGHVVFGREYEYDEGIDLEIYNVNKERLSDISLVSDLNFAKEYDLALYKVHSVISHLNLVTISEQIVNPQLITLAYIKATDLDERVFIDPITCSEKLFESSVRYKVPTNSFNNFQVDEFGASAMGGISGSPAILLTNDNQLVFHGIIEKIPNQGTGDLVDIRGLAPLKKYIDSLEVVEKLDFDGNSSLIKFSGARIDKLMLEQWVEKWKNEPENDGYYHNLEKKLKVIYGDDYHKELEKELKKIMVGDELIKTTIEKESQLFLDYEEVTDAAASHTQVKYVSNAQEAYEYYDKTYNDHFDSITEDLGKFGLKKSQRMRLAQYDIATWMAVCNLRFEEK